VSVAPAPAAAPIGDRLRGSARLARARRRTQDLAAREALGRKRARAIARYAHANVPRFRDAFDEAGIDPAQVDDPADFLALPALDRDHLQSGQAFAAGPGAPEVALRLTSSGTTGAPRAVTYDRSGLIEAVAQSFRQQQRIERISGGPVRRQLDVTVPGSSISRVNAAVRANTVGRARVQRHHESLFQDPDRIAASVERLRPDVLRSYGSCLDGLVPVLAERPELLPRAIAYTADGPSTTTVRVVREQLGLPLFSSYQAVEALMLGADCEHRTGHHVNPALHCVRIVDELGREVADGTVGEVSVSCLTNRATVLLNYRLGDRARLETGSCPCGDPSPRLSYPHGRVGEWLTKPDGSREHPYAIIEAFAHELSIRQYSVEQREAGAFAARVVLAPRSDLEAIRRSLTASLAEYLGCAVEISLEPVDRIATTAGGKLRPFHSLIA
jgi:phenylacetate-CoA ligase